MSLNTARNYSEFTAPPAVADWQRKAFLSGGLLSVASVIGVFLNPEQAMHSYLVGFMLILGLSMGPLALLMVWHVTGGNWGVGIRRILEAAAATLPLVMVAFVPLLFGLSANYKWARPEVLAQSEHIRHLAHVYLNLPMFALRGLVYFAIWGTIAWFLLRWSWEQDQPGSDVGKRLSALSAPGLVIYFWTITLATVDWVMSAAVPWFSSIYALIFAIGQGAIGLCFTVIVARALRNRGVMAEVLPSRNFHDYGKFMLMFVMVWAWFSYSQWLLIWSGNLPEEIHFFLDRGAGGWQYVTWVLVVGHFAIPFALLLSRGLKQDPNRLVWVAAWLIAMRYLDLYWNIMPNYSPKLFAFGWLHAVVPLGMGGLWTGFFFWNLQRRPLVALNDPRLQEMLEMQHE